MAVSGVKRRDACLNCGGPITGRGRFHVCVECGAHVKWCSPCQRLHPLAAFQAPGGGRSYGECYEQHRQRNDRRNQTPEGKRRFYICHLKRKFGISEEESVALAAVRECQACGLRVESEEAAYKKLHVDHDHATGKVRGVLCVRCNHATPVLEDPAWEAKVRAYLERADGAT